jgi:hypothetical protein
MEQPGASTNIHQMQFMQKLQGSNPAATGNNLGGGSQNKFPQGQFDNKQGGPSLQLQMPFAPSNNYVQSMNLAG